MGGEAYISKTRLSSGGHLALQECWESLGAPLTPSAPGGPEVLQRITGFLLMVVIEYRSARSHYMNLHV